MAVMGRLYILICCALALSAQIESARNPYTAAADIAQGKRLFDGHCAGCHGPGGEGGRGAVLARPTLRRAPDDAALFSVIQDGVQGTEMPRAVELTEHEIWQVAAFVRTLGRVEAAQVIPGNAGRGERLFRSSGCPACHMVKMQGGTMGPDLSDIGASRSAVYLREALVDPEASAPEGFMQVRLTAAGKRISGILLNEDTYSVQIRDLSGQLHSFWKRELSEYRKERGKSPMPSYRGKLAAAELDDVAAYLVSLRGEL